MCSTDPDATKRPPPQRVSSVFMHGAWTVHAYSMSHDGQTVIIHYDDGIEVQRMGRAPVRLKMHLPFVPRDMTFGPDSRRVAFWAPPDAKNLGGRQLAVMDTTRVTRAEDPPPLEIVYTPDTSRSAFGFEWSPRGDALFVIEATQDPLTQERYNTIVRVDLGDLKHPKEIVRMSGGIDFFMPPTSRYEHGEGPSTRDFRIVFGHRDGLFVVDPDGKRAERASHLPAIGLYNVEWSPDASKEIVALFFRRAVNNEDGRNFKGVWLVNLRQHGPNGDEGQEQLYDRDDVHTLWFSPRGTYVCWATPSTLYYRRVTDAPDKTVQLHAAPVDGAELDMKGAAWSNDERKLAFTAGNRLFIHEVGATTPPLELAAFGEVGTSFSAEPHFVGDMVYLSVFGNVGAKMSNRPAAQFGMPGDHTDPTIIKPNPTTPLGGAPAPAPTPPSPRPTPRPRRP